jgi:Tfp pilus assembly protein PilO
VRARGREIIIITAVIIVVVIVAWWFLFFNPLRKDVSSLNDQIATAQKTLTAAQTTLTRLKGYQKTSPQTQADLLRYNKMMPSQTGVPGIIIELQRTAEDNTLEFAGITPGVVAPGSPFSVQSVTLSFTGGFYAYQDFLAAVEQYVQYQNDQFLVTGRLLAVSAITMAPASTDATTSDLAISMTIDAYLWTGVSPSGASTGTPTPSTTTPAPSVSASSSASPSASASPGAESPSPSASPTETGSASASPSSSPTTESSTSPTTEASP